VVSVYSQGSIFWYDTKVTSAELGKRFASVSSQKPQPEVQIRGDGRADYKSVGQIVSSAQAAGIAKIGFITEPAAK
jgi:biopolymer transport protein ExbD